MSLETKFLERALYIDKVLTLIRGEIRRREGILIEEEDLARAAHDMLSVDAHEEIGLTNADVNAVTRTEEEPLIPEVVSEG
jgi:hypothetical protein